MPSIGSFDLGAIPFGFIVSGNGTRQRVGKGENATNGFHLHLCYERQITPVICASRYRKAKTSRSGKHGLSMTTTTLRRDGCQAAMLTRTLHSRALKSYLKRFNFLWTVKRPIGLRRGTFFPHRARERQHETRRAQLADNLPLSNSNSKLKLIIGRRSRDRGRGYRRRDCHPRHRCCEPRMALAHQEPPCRSKCHQQ